MICPHCSKEIPRTRTEDQNSALWLFYTQLAQVLNESGLDMRKVLKPTYNIPWTKNSIHDHLWIPLQKLLCGTTSTRDLDKVSDINEIYELLVRELGEKHGVEVPPFPHDPDKIPLHYHPSLNKK